MFSLRNFKIVTHLEEQGALQSPSREQIALLKDYTKDSDYLSWITNCNSGYYYEGALQIYGFDSVDEFSSIILVNKELKLQYIDDFENLFAFGQDIFGNQFCFDSGNEIIFFNIESAEKEVLADSFISWEKVLQEDLEYLTGLNIRKEYVSSNGNIELSDRLCPKIPFIAGGDYSLDNLYHLTTIKCIAANSNIARQVKDLPDGTLINFQVSN